MDSEFFLSQSLYFYFCNTAITLLAIFFQNKKMFLFQFPVQLFSTRNGRFQCNLSILKHCVLINMEPLAELFRIPYLFRGVNQNNESQNYWRIKL